MIVLPGQIKVEVLINAVHDPHGVKPPRIALTLKLGRKMTLFRVEMDPADFGLAMTGRSAFGVLTRTDVLTHGMLDKIAPGVVPEQEPHLAKQE